MAAAASLAVSVADSVIQATPVVAEDAAKTHVVIEPTFFLSDFEGIGADLGKGARNIGERVLEGAGTMRHDLGTILAHGRHKRQNTAANARGADSCSLASKAAELLSPIHP